MSQKIELSFRAITIGLFLSVIMAAANVYLGLKAGMTVSASIPAAVMAMGLLRLFPKPGTIYESNLVQTAASAGESLAAGIIFTMPALVIAGIWQTFDFWVTSLIALTGGLMGILLMIPMRKVFITSNDELPYPEGVACAEVLSAGIEGDSKSATMILQAILIGGLFKFVGSFLGLLKSAVEVATRLGERIFYFGSDISPALVAVGFIVELPIAILIFSGGAMAWVIGIPLFPSEAGSAMEGAWTLWSQQIRYVGVGAMVVGGIESIFNVRQGLVSAVTEMKTHMMGKSNENDDSGQRNLSGKTILFFFVSCLVLTFFIYRQVIGNFPVTVLATLIMLILSFFFTAVASYIVGLVGNSNSPVSGMTISAVLATSGLLYVLGYAGETGILATLVVAGVVCCVCCTAGDVCNDLKTGDIIGATPRNQQIMQIAGVMVASFILAPVLIAMHEGSIQMGGTGIGGKDYPAPQANLFASLTKGIFAEGQLPWNMIIAGAVLGLLIIFLDRFLKNKIKYRLHLMPIAVGIYLPLTVSTPILLGGFIGYFIKKKTTPKKFASKKKKGILFSSGLIAGESLVGVALALLAYFNVAGPSWFKGANSFAFSLVSVVALGLVCFVLYRSTVTEHEP